MPICPLKTDNYASFLLLYQTEWHRKIAFWVGIPSLRL